MHSNARLQTVITLLQRCLHETYKPADAVVTEHYRANRYIGSHDRRAIADQFWTICRKVLQLRWLAETFAPDEMTPLTQARLMVLAFLRVVERADEAALRAVFDGGQYAPDALTPAEKTFIQRLTPEVMTQAPRGVQLNIEDEILDLLQDWTEAEVQAFLMASEAQAPLDLRVNTLKKYSRNEVIQQFKASGVQAQPTPYAAQGLRIGARISLSDNPLYTEGVVEIQDEGSQLIATLVDARPGLRVLDYCAGAGGKTLAIAADMKNRGVLVGCDILESRLIRARKRLRRADVHNVQMRLLDENGRKWVARQTKAFDRVLVDVPCSGAGTWRRNPDMRWRLTRKTVDELVQKQRDILVAVAPLVRPGGRLVYSTCSVFSCENQAQIEWFLNLHPDYHLVPLLVAAPELARQTEGRDYLALRPQRHGTDGFFAAVLERR